MYRRPMAERTAFDVVVKPGESIQAAIEKAPEIPTVPFKILLLNGTYHQKVIIDRPNIVLVGENRDSTRIVLAETAQTRAITEYHGRPVGNGVIVLQEGADDCVISGLTVYNNYGTAIENTTIHQMAIFGRATRTIIINSNVWADGNDALSLWAPGSNGMYYHADLYLRCPGVDFLCPRGWCYATRCHFYGDSRAMIWHDGRGDKNKKLVITNSSFDAKTPTLLGRYHHDSQFYLIKCKMSKNVLDGNIHYAYSDKDYTYLGNGLPKWYFNLASTLTWKDFDFSFQLRGAAGFKVLNTKRIYYENSVSLPFNLLKSALGRPLNDAATFSDYYLEKGNYLKLDNITVGYTFDLSQLKYVSNARIYATATNLLTITGYTGVDPEVGTGLTPGFDDSGYYPRSTTLMLGLNIKF